MEKLIVSIIFLLITMRAIRIYSRTGLKGELIIATAGFIFLLGFYSNDTILMWIAFVILNIGLLILYSSEKYIVRQIYRQLTIYKRLIGDYPQILDENESQRANKISGVVSGILCLVTAIELYRIKINNIWVSVDKNTFDLIGVGILILAGILLIVYYSFKKVV